MPKRSSSNHSEWYRPINCHVDGSAFARLYNSDCTTQDEAVTIVAQIARLHHRHLPAGYARELQAVIYVERIRNCRDWLLDP